MIDKIYKLTLQNRRKDVYELLKRLGCAFKFVDEVDIDELIIDQGIYPREKTDWERVEMYTENLEDGDTFPPILIAEREKDFAKIILDGNHRFYAFKKLGFEKIPAEIWEVPESLYPIVAQAVNTEEKETDTPLTPTEKKKAIIRDWEILTQYPKDERKRVIAWVVRTTVSYVDYVLSTAGILKSEKEEKKKKAEELRNKGYTYKQISEELGIPVPTLKRWLSEKVPKFSQQKNDTPTYPTEEPYEENKTQFVKSLEDKKKQALELHDEGYEVEEIAEKLGVNEITVSRWIKEEEGGIYTTIETEEYDGSWDDWNDYEEEEEEPAEEKPKPKKEKEPKKLLHPNQILERCKTEIWDAVIEIEFRLGEDKALEVLEEIYFAYKERKHKGLTIYKDIRARYDAYEK